MQASGSPWEWWAREAPRRVRLSLQELQQARALQQATDLQRWGKQPWPRLRPDLTLYTPSQLRQLIRLEGGVLESGQLVVPTPPPWLRERHALDAGATWGMAQLPVSYKVEKTSAGSVRWWSGGACAGGAALLALLLLLLRDSCRARLRTIGRRLSDEWPTPSVLATSHQSEVGASDHVLPLETAGGSDQPPPYSECASVPPHHVSTKPPLAYDEPPPPYSACVVAYYKRGVLASQDSQLTRTFTPDPTTEPTQENAIRIEIPTDNNNQQSEDQPEGLNDEQNNNVPEDETVTTGGSSDEVMNERLLTAGVVQIDNSSRGIVV